MRYVLRAIFLPVTCVCILALATPAMAEEGYGSQAGAKLSRGFVNTLTGWVELPKNIANESKKSNVAVGLTWGTIKGVFNTVGRTAVGAVELVTFFIPNEEFVHPTYAWDPFDEETRYGSR